MLYICIVAALYLYFDGNCKFYKSRKYAEDDEENSPEYKKGLAVMILCLFEAALNFSWPSVYFKRQEYGRASFMIISMIILNIIIMTMMGITEKCTLDTLTNRYYISAGLYAVYTAWLVIACIITVYTWLKRKSIIKAASDKKNIQ